MVLSSLWHAVAGLYLCVCPVARPPTFIIVSNNNALALHIQLGVRHYSRLRVECHPKASSLPLVDLGPYRCVLFIALHCSALSAGLIYPHLEIYSTTRIASVICLAVCLYGLNVSTPYNCEVRVLHIDITCLRSDWPWFEGQGRSPTCELIRCA